MNVVYTSRDREVTCYAEPDAASGGYLGKVRVTVHHGDMFGEVLHDCSQPDHTEAQALRRAEHWARHRYAATAPKTTG